MKRYLEYLLPIVISIAIGLVLLYIGHNISAFTNENAQIVAIIGWLGFMWSVIYIYRRKSVKRYLVPLRLEDVIRLISALALDVSDFKTEASVVEAIRGNPHSTETWHEIVQLHPEFFRPNAPETHAALLMRSYKIPPSGKPREPLSIEETQKLIDVAISLHEKEVQRSQRFTIWFPLIGSVIGALAVAVASYFTHIKH